ncbi:P-loop containing nucleoside triphosphate hydrolase protein [Scenedesmus sp. NREL 46B-D3]|nr:P-loop containing nucleoside triphosphate hydrolase protein [Scenedesmus sp. NREL 46B-D3]
MCGALPAVQPAARQSFLHFVDLAGCERVKRTGNSGARLRESVAINSSLMTLARCLEVLRYNQQHPGDEKVIPYRESKITHLFKQVLHGNGRFVMVVNVSPASEAFNETKRVLQEGAAATKEGEAAEQPPPAAAAAAAAASEALPQKTSRNKAAQRDQQQQQPEAVEETWQPAERVLADVTRQQLGVAVGRRATIATLRAGSCAAAAAAGQGGSRQALKGAGGTLTPVAFRTRHRHGR